ncbi:ATP-binding protein [Streptomyces nanhaiensis]|uniref:ATP-binding protein n=1 Tax=Streptomyces nanhaiensis TaxID=679319 RepID=UPI00399C94C4
MPRPGGRTAGHRPRTGARRRDQPSTLTGGPLEHAPFPKPIPFAEPWEYELRFPRDPRGPGIARRTLRAVLAAHGLLELAGRAELLTSEPATDSVRYTEHAAAVTLRWLHPVLRVSVWDAGPGGVPAPSSSPPPPDREGGRGLLILDVLADRWGDCPAGDGPAGPGGPVGKTVRFELLRGGPRTRPTWCPPPDGEPTASGGRRVRSRGGRRGCRAAGWWGGR